jgi:hypothetical protein
MGKVITKKVINKMGKIVEFYIVYFIDNEKTRSIPIEETLEEFSGLGNYKFRFLLGFRPSEEKYRAKSTYYANTNLVTIILPEETIQKHSLLALKGIIAHEIIDIDSAIQGAQPLPNYLMQEAKVDSIAAIVYGIDPISAMSIEEINDLIKREKYDVILENYSIYLSYCDKKLYDKIIGHLESQLSNSPIYKELIKKIERKGKN